MWQPNDQLPDFYRSALKSTLDMIHAGLAGMERVQGYQAGAVEEMRSSHGEMSKRIGSLRSLPELQEAHAELMRRQLAAMAAHWSGLSAACYQYQVDMFTDAQAKAREVTEELTQKMDAAPTGAMPILSAMKLVVGAAQSTCAATVRATEEMARLSAARIEATKASATRAGNGKAKRAA